MSLPVCIDLDGTLLRTDVLSEALLLFASQYPYKIGLLLLWFLRGRSFLKFKISQQISLPIEQLPVNTQILEVICHYKSLGNPLYLVTAAPEQYAHQCARHFAVFDDVFASSEKMNLRGIHKAAFLARKFGEKGYIYAGNSRHDLPVWQSAAVILAINVLPSVHARIALLPQTATFFEEKERHGRRFFKGICCYVYPNFNLRRGMNLAFAAILLTLLMSWFCRDKIFFEGKLGVKILFLSLGLILLRTGIKILTDLFNLEVLRHQKPVTNLIANGELPLGQTLRYALAFIISGCVMVLTLIL